MCIRDSLHLAQRRTDEHLEAAVRRSRVARQTEYGRAVDPVSYTHLMPTRDERKAAAASNLALMRGAFSKDPQETIDAAIIYEDGEGRELELPEVEEGAATTTSAVSYTHLDVYKRQAESWS